MLWNEKIKEIKEKDGKVFEVFLGDEKAIREEQHRHDKSINTLYDVRDSSKKEVKLFMATNEISEFIYYSKKEGVAFRVILKNNYLSYRKVSSIAGK